MIIGITGKYCAGKDTAVKLVKNYGFSEINLDQIGHTVLEEKQAEIIAAFGEEIRSADGRIDRARLGRLVFGDRRKLKTLEALLHPAMIGQTERMVAARKDNLVINAALLFKMGLERLCDFILCLKAPLIVRLCRARKRDGLTLRQILRRFRAQNEICPKNPAPDADIYHISNIGAQKDLERKIRGLLDAKLKPNLG
jgi:dephospho-CoA kinase